MRISPLPVLTLSLLASSQAWLSTHPAKSCGSTPLQMSTEGTEASASLDRFPVTTKTNKKLIFDEKTGRFFETSLLPDTAFSAAAKERFDSSYELAADLAFTSNEMVPTELLFRNRQSTFLEEVEEALPELVAVMEDEMEEKDQDDNTPAPSNSNSDLTIISVVEEFFAAWNDRDMDAVMACIDDQIEYQDTQYFGTITSKSELRKHIENQSKLLPPDSKIVFENIAVDPSNGNIGAQWYLIQGDDPTPLPLTRGCSFYQTNPNTGLIQKGFKASEMIVKPSKRAANQLVASVSRFQQWQRSPSSYSKLESAKSDNIIETYFNAWNRRDMEAALDCFVDDCVYQTEDPVFVDTFQGKAALKEHLEKNAKSLPPSCRIILDQVAVDPIENTIATMWHLEVNGIAIPNLRGCSMYTTTADGSKLVSGYDVTEAPVKLPRQALLPTQLLPTQLLQLPSRAFLSRR